MHLTHQVNSPAGIITVEAPTLHDLREYNHEAVSAWLDMIHGTSPGLIHICSVGNWTGRTFSDASDAANYVARLDSEGREGIYMRTTTLSRIPKDEQGRAVRGGVELSLALPGFAGDIDIDGPGHKHDPNKHDGRTLPPDIPTAMSIVTESGLPAPTLWVHSGGGLYPWWLFNDAYLVDTPENLKAAETVSTQLQTVLRHAALKLGWHYGGEVGDLARVMRIPGTVNRKAGGAATAQILEPAAYEFQDFDELAVEVDRLHAALPPVEAPRPLNPPRILTRSDDISPGDDFEMRSHWADILTPHGWEYMYSRGRTMYWKRPGKTTPGHSATTGRAADRDRLYAFSGEAAPFQADTPYTKFAAHALLNFNGDFAAAASDLRRQGFGGQRPDDGGRARLSSLVPLRGRGPEVSNPVPVVESAVSEPVEITPAEEPTPQIDGTPSSAYAPPLDGNQLPVFNNSIFATQKWGEMGLVNLYVEVFSPTLRYMASANQWMIWSGQRWERDDLLRHHYAGRVLIERMEKHANDVNDKDPDTGKALVAAAKRFATLQKVNSLPKSVQSDPRISVKDHEFDREDHLVTVDNGVLNLNTVELQPFDVNLMLTKKMNTPFDPDAQGNRLHAFLNGIMPDEEVRKYVQRLLAVTLLGQADERAIVMLYGGSGSGKSAFLEMIYAIFGDFAAVAEESTFKPLPNDYQGPSDKLHKLKGSRFVKMSELTEGASLNQSTVKNVTGSDTQSTRPLYGQLSEWKVQYMVWMATNHLPRITSNDEAIWNRIKPIHFPGRFIDAQGRVARPEDKDLGRKIAREEPAAVLNWILEGLKEYRENGLSEPAVISEWLNAYRDEVDTTRQFVTEAAETGQIKVEQGQQVGVRELYRAYTAWCADSQVKPVASNSFTQRMLANGWEKKKREKGIMWQGIGLDGFLVAAQSRAASWPTSSFKASPMLV